MTFVPVSATLLRISLIEGVTGDVPRAERDAVPAGGARNPALGQLRASSRPALRPVREVLAALAPGRVLPFAPGNSRKRGPELSQGVKALASAAVERRKASGLPLMARFRAPRTFRWRHLIVWRGPRQIAPFGASLPSAYREDAQRIKQASDASAPRERFSISSLPGSTRQSMGQGRSFILAAWFDSLHFSMGHRVKPSGDEGGMAPAPRPHPSRAATRPPQDDGEGCEVTHRPRPFHRP